MSERLVKDMGTGVGVGVQKNQTRSGEWPQPLVRSTFPAGQLLKCVADYAAKSVMPKSQAEWRTQRGSRCH